MVEAFEGNKGQIRDDAAGIQGDHGPNNRDGIVATQTYIAFRACCRRDLDALFALGLPDAGVVGKVNFKAVARIVDGRDAFPADNEFISPTVTVRPR